MTLLLYLFTYSKPTLFLFHYYFFLLSSDPWSVNVNGLRMLKGDSFVLSESSFFIYCESSPLPSPPQCMKKDNEFSEYLYIPIT